MSSPDRETLYSFIHSFIHSTIYIAPL